jgi:hypothetical protein
MKCDICPQIIVGDEIHRFSLHKKEFCLCGWCALRVYQYIQNNTTHHTINIYWGAGHVCWSSWNTLREFIRKYNITEVLEMGIGLSSELFVNEGLKVVGIDIWKEHVQMYQELLSLKNVAEFHWYPDSDHLPDFDVLYPGRTWDFVFVDGPQERSREVKLAMKLANKFIYLHDPNMGEQSFFPGDGWEGVGPEPRLFIKK